MVQFSKGIYRNPTSGAKINTENYTGRDSLGNVITGGLTPENLSGQGYEQLKSSLVNGGELFAGSSGYQEFVQRPQGFNADDLAGSLGQGSPNNVNFQSPGGNGAKVVFTNPMTNEAVHVDPSDYNTMKDLASQGYSTPTPGYMPDITPNSISTGSVVGEAGSLNDQLKSTTDLFTREREANIAETNAIIEDLKSDYESQRASAEAAQGEEIKTDKAIQFRLGQSGSSYGLAETKRRDLQRRAELEGLLAKKQNLISKAQRAANSDDIKLLKEYTKQIQDLDNTFYERKRQQRQDQIKEYIDLGQEDRARTKAPFEIAEQIADTLAKIPEGQEFEVDGKKYVGTMVPESEKDFFSGGNIISLMGQLETGETQTIEDPNTGRVWNITGTKEPATVAAYDDAGNLSIVRKDTGEVISKAEGVGKSKTAPVSIIMGNQEKGAKQEIVDNLNNARDPQTGKVSPDAYVSQFTTFLLNNLGDIGAFRASFPPSLYLSKEEADAVNQELATAEAGLSTLKKDDEEEPLF